MTWAHCSLRKYLSSDFYNKSTSDEQSRIIQVLNKNYDNQWYGSRGGVDTFDYIFILSIEEVVCKYFGDSSKNIENRSTKQGYWFQWKDNNKRKSTLDGEVWW